MPWVPVQASYLYRRVLVPVAMSCCLGSNLTRRADTGKAVCNDRFVGLSMMLILMLA
jgi:hypothetical protein